MKPLKDSVTITVDSDILEKTRHLAEEDERTLSQYINIVLKANLRSKGLLEPVERK